MDKPRNKGNQKSGGKNTKITAVFKVKKCLFNSQPEFKSPASRSSDHLPCYGKPSYSPDIMNSLDESPYSLFSISRQRDEATEMQFRLDSTTPNKMDCTTTPLRRSQSLRSFFKDETTPNNPVKLAVQKSIQNPDLIGDFSKPCILPTIEGKHSDLKTVSPNTVANLFQQNSFFNFTIVDCRYPYEFDGGHIKTALNIYCNSNAEEKFFTNKENLNRNIFLFYCEFSSERAPSMIRYIRSRDRDLNKDNYPHLYYPELYVIEGGYKSFYSSFEELCEPKGYMPMLHEDFSDEMNYFRIQCKTWKLRSKRWTKKNETSKR